MAIINPIQYPITKLDGDTIFIFGEEETPGTDEWYAERDRIQALFRDSETREANGEEVSELDLTRS